MLRDFIGIRVNRAKKSGMVNITSSVNSRERSGINTILHELNPLFTINVRSEERFSRNAETDLVCRLLLEKKKHAEAFARRAACERTRGERPRGEPALPRAAARRLERRHPPACR